MPLATLNPGKLATVLMKEAMPQRGITFQPGATRPGFCTPPYRPQPEGLPHSLIDLPGTSHVGAPLQGAPGVVPPHPGRCPGLGWFAPLGQQACGSRVQ